MNLEKKLNTIDIPKISSIKSGEANTIKEFWNTFIKPNLISKEVIKKWCDLLYRYVEDKDVVYALRTFNNRGPNGDKDLRRGFITKTNKGYSFFYTDNFFSAYFMKMAIDGYVPEYSEFKSMLLTRKFPARFGMSCQSERDKAAYKINGKDPKINAAGYKISHIFDVGTGYLYCNNNYSISEICSKYFPRGNYEDWTSITDNTGTYYSRTIKINDDAIEYLKAIFLRMTCPLNYILTPKKTLHTTKVEVDKNDIGEFRVLQEYAIQQFSEIYGDIYKEFIGKILTPIKYQANNNFGDYYIGIKYGMNLEQTKISQDSMIMSVSRPSKKIETNSKINALSDKLKAECLYAYLFEGLSFRRIEMDIMHIDSPARGGGFKAQELMRSYSLQAEMKGIFKNISQDEIIKIATENKNTLVPALKLIFSELLSQNN